MNNLMIEQRLKEFMAAKQTQERLKIVQKAKHELSQAELIEFLTSCLNYYMLVY